LFQALWSSPEELCNRFTRRAVFAGNHWCSAHRGASADASEFNRKIDEHQWGSHAKRWNRGGNSRSVFRPLLAADSRRIQEALWHIEQVVERELNALPTDNPLVFPETQSVIHCGNFYGQQSRWRADYRASVWPMRAACWNASWNGL